ncbi:MAG: hypothetical protein K8R88_00200 [Armatimonadetes bacterium]|nr:hypothetical protein [Armatimonadota bacterium]
MMFLPTLALLTILQDGVAKESGNDANSAPTKAAIAATGLSNELSASGLSYKIDFTHPESRKQTVYVTAKPSATIKGLLTTFIYTTVWVSKEAPTSELLLKVLTQTKKIGQFYVFKDSKDVWCIRFGANFNATELKESSTSTDPLVTNLKDTIYFVNQVGEEADKELNGNQDIK